VSLLLIVSTLLFRGRSVSFDHVIQEILSKTPLVELIGADVRLQRKGSDYVGLCPFHQEKTPSFTVSETKNYYHCFGCGAHGNAIGYVMNKSNIPFKEALTILAAKAGVQLPRQDGRSKQKQQSAQDQKRKLLDLHKIASDYFQTTLLNSGSSEHVRKYLQNRQISKQMIDQFKLGYCDGTLTKRLIHLGYSEEVLIQSGLVIREEKNKTLRDRFINRLMFPIFDIQNRPIAFGGRTLNNDNPNIPKYLNSSETPLFHKGYNLYNLHDAVKHSKQAPLILVEGYIDVISMVSHGFPQAVASLGTALTESQVEILWRYSSEPILCFDGDNAGVRASIRVVRTLIAALRPGKTLLFCYLPKDLDPDELLRTHGASMMQQCLDRAFPFADVLWRDLVSKYEKKNAGRDRWIPEDRAALKLEILNTVKLIRNAELQEQYRQLFLEKLNALHKQPLKARPVPNVMRISSQLKPQKSLGHKVLLGIILKKPAILQYIDELLAIVEFPDTNLAEIKNWLLSTPSEKLCDPAFLPQCDIFLNALGIESLHVHAPFAFDENVPTDFAVKRWREIWFCTIGYSTIKRDFRLVGNNLKKSFDEKSWEQMKALFSNISDFR
jgi:DNA primase